MSQKNRWELTDEVRQKFTPIIEDFIRRVEENDPEGEPLTLDLCNTELNPYTLQKLLEEMGYSVEWAGDNGWQLDFWYNVEKEGMKPLSLHGTGITFSLYLSEEA
jgi:hypothetical protein